MRRLVVGALMSVVAVASAFASAASAATPSLTASFASSAPAIGSADPLTFTITGGDGGVSDVGFSSSVPGPPLNVVASSSSQCGGTLTTTAEPGTTPMVASASITLTGASVAAGQSCSVTVLVLVQEAGTDGVNTSTFTSAGNPDNFPINPDSANPRLTVPTTAAMPAVTSLFTPSTVEEHGTTTWALKITNTDPTTTLTDVGYDVTLFTPQTPQAFVANTCGGTGSLTPTPEQPPLLSAEGGFLYYSGGTLAPGASCVIAINVSASGYASQTMFGVGVSSIQTGAGNVVYPQFTTVAPATSPGAAKTPTNAFTHIKPKIARDGTVIETVSLPGKGKVVVRETWRGKLIVQVTKAVKGKSKLTVKLTPSRAARRALKAHKGATVKLLVGYTPTGGKARTVKLTARTARGSTRQRAARGRRVVGRT